jgi:hypothetical protein
LPGNGYAAKSPGHQLRGTVDTPLFNVPLSCNSVVCRMTVLVKSSYFPSTTLMLSPALMLGPGPVAEA